MQRGGPQTRVKVAQLAAEYTRRATLRRAAGASRLPVPPRGRVPAGAGGEGGEGHMDPLPVRHQTRARERGTRAAARLPSVLAARARARDKRAR